MPSKAPKTPSYRLHKPTGQAVVTVGGRDIYLGPHGTEASKKAYDRVTGEWLANGRRTIHQDAITVAELIARYLDHVDATYASAEPANIRLAIRAVREVYGTTPAVDFGPLALKSIRQRMIESDLCRNEVNRRTRKIVRLFKWAVSEQLVASGVLEALRAVDGIRRGRGVRESKPVKPVHDSHVDATLPYLSRQVRAMVELQRLTGARPGEICSMRTIDVNTSGRIWEYTPATHKTEHHGKTRVIFIGPAAQKILRPWLRVELEAYLFQPREAEAERMVALRTARKSKVQPSQVDRSKPGGSSRFADAYIPGSYRQSISRAVKRANADRKPTDPVIPDWHPHQLRHTAATMLRREFGLDVARAVLGHSSPVVTEVYAELDAAKAREAMERVG
ncbi:MAG: tyrosine-type recombinase/integrase [Paludisphaera borealis]|uniref:tyrosine-type recombinase/integrase n=1 Tax=Paludisphaera borealis TaxID=1387353 RepID=UPI00283F4E48|nr:tyrosine-type recombinase/integrase [Paludisphaera borealis]MDR3621576.1 tyrosine-type recombinase/integrase [Paludisphaera borealis]